METWRYLTEIPPDQICIRYYLKSETMSVFLTTSLLLFGLVETVRGTSCTACLGTFTQDYTAAANDPAKCMEVEKYIACLDTSQKDDPGCPLTAALAADIETKFNDASCSFTDTCLCQKDFWKTDQSSGNAGVCTAVRTYLLCVNGKGATTCDATANIDVITLVTGVEARMRTLGNDCPISPACECQISTAKTVMSTNQEKCSAYQAELGCLARTMTSGCDATTPKHTIASATKALKDALPGDDCPPNTLCTCEITAATADSSTDEKYCTNLNTLSNCVKAETDTRKVGCSCLTQENLYQLSMYAKSLPPCGTADHVTSALLLMASMLFLQKLVQ